jgi:hypothetical protein
MLTFCVFALYVGPHFSTIPVQALGGQFQNWNSQIPKWALAFFLSWCRYGDHTELVRSFKTGCPVPEYGKWQITVRPILALGNQFRNWVPQIGMVPIWVFGCSSSGTGRPVPELERCWNGVQRIQISLTVAKIHLVWYSRTSSFGYRLLQHATKLCGIVKK